MLSSLCYLSTAARRMSDAELEDILRDARLKNDAAGITGTLLYCDGNFMQYVEGPTEAIEGLWRRLGHDPRHHGIIELFRQPLSERIFGGWSMAFKSADARRFDALVQMARVPLQPGDERQPPVVAMLRDFWLDNR